MIIGLSGRNGVGKGEVLAFLESRSFYAHSLSDVIRDELSRQGQSETRERMIETGNAIRQARGPGGLATILAEHLLPDRNQAANPATASRLQRRNRARFLNARQRCRARERSHRDRRWRPNSAAAGTESAECR